MCILGAMDPWRMYADERADIHDFLASLAPGQWNAPSLCEGWRVRDVAVHLLVDEPVEQLGLPRALVKAASLRFSVHRINDWWVERNRDRPTDSIAAAFAGAWRRGPELSGAAESILMAVAGRSVALAELSGEGIPTLAARVQTLD